MSGLREPFTIGRGFFARACFSILVGALVLSGSGAALADAITIPYTFAPNTPALAAQVNSNFSTVATGVNANADDIYALNTKIVALQSAVAALQGTVASQATTISSQATTISSLQSALAAVQNNSVLTLDGKLGLLVDPVTSQPTAQFAGVNVQVVNGMGTTATTNAVGNLIVGYNEDAGLIAFCSNGTYADQTSCQNNGGTWATNQRSGSHNLIVGNANAYSRYGGLMGGFRNIANGPYASVGGGLFNTARGGYSSVSGGYGNTASGGWSWIGGGDYNNAVGDDSAISGGYDNTASGGYSSVSGGYGNTASGYYSSVSGGNYNTASGWFSSVSGGYNHTAPNQYNWAAGTYSAGQ